LGETKVDANYHDPSSQEKGEKNGSATVFMNITELQKKKFFPTKRKTRGGIGEEDIFHRQGKRNGEATDDYTKRKRVAIVRGESELTLRP